MLEAKLQSASVFKRLVECLSVTLGDVNFDCNESGLTLQSMDSGHVALVYLNLSSDGFDSYRCDRNLHIGININSLNKILKASNNDDSLTLSASDNGNTLNLLFESPSGDRISEYEMKLLTVDSELLAVPDNEYDVCVKMPSNEFKRICSDLSILHDTASIKSKKDGVTFSAEGDLGSGSITIKPSSAADSDAKKTVSIRVKNPSEISIGLKFLNQFCKASTLSEDVTLQMQDDLPMSVQYNLPDSLGTLQYYLAPKGDDEE